MKKVLMLDLEGVFFPTERHALRGEMIRTGSRRFMEKILPLFNEKYICSCVKEESALRIMRERFGVYDIDYHEWDRSSPYGKASRYHEFENSKIFHVEDGAVDNYESNFKNPERQRIRELGHLFIPVRGWHTYHYRPEYIEEKMLHKRDLYRVIKEIKKEIKKLNLPSK